MLFLELPSGHVIVIITACVHVMHKTRIRTIDNPRIVLRKPRIQPLHRQSEDCTCVNQ